MDKEIKCVERECPTTFTITEGEEKFYTDKGMYLPKRCQECRDKRRNERDARTEEN